VTVDVEDEGRIVGSRRWRCRRTARRRRCAIRATATEPGPRLFKFRVAPQDGEVVTQNNVRESMINVRDDTERILYFEGEPRWR
jgi:hypothetical protein